MNASAALVDGRSHAGAARGGRRRERQDRRLRRGHRDRAGGWARRPRARARDRAGRAAARAAAHDLGTEIALLHSALSDGERADEWRRIRSGEARVVVGTRTGRPRAARRLGRDRSSTRSTTRHTSRTARRATRRATWPSSWAAWPARRSSWAAPHPTWSSLGRARAGELRAASPRRPRWPAPAAGGGGRPSRRAGRRQPGPAVCAGWSTRSARSTRPVGDQAILVINRRGAASVVVCRDCGYVQICPECQRPLVFHAASQSLRCHHCGATAPVARRCPACDSPRIRYLGGGTERVEREVSAALPDRCASAGSIATSSSARARRRG